MAEMVQEKIFGKIEVMVLIDLVAGTSCLQQLTARVVAATLFESRMLSLLIVEVVAKVYLFVVKSLMTQIILHSWLDEATDRPENETCFWLTAVLGIGHMGIRCDYSIIMANDTLVQSNILRTCLG
jgi:hypothetical protein